MDINSSAVTPDSDNPSDTEEKQDPTVGNDGRVLLQEVKSVKKILAESMKQENFKSYELAIEIGVTPVYLSKVVNERRELKISVLDKLSKKLRFSDADFAFLLSVARRSVKSISSIDVDSVAGGNAAKAELLLAMADSLKSMPEEEAENLFENFEKTTFFLVLNKKKRVVSID